VRARSVYFGLEASGSLASAIAFTVVALYRTGVAGLDPLGLVLAGTVMEGTILLFEIPTGVVADVVSRKRSIVIGHAVMGAGFLVEAARPSLAGVLLGQALWGLGYTFTSGATVAWLAGELHDDDELGTLMLRGSAAGSAAALVGAASTYFIASWSLRAPLVMASMLQLAVASWLLLAMPETGFEPTARGEGSTRTAMLATARAGFGAVRRSRVLVLAAVAIFLAGGASEAYDRFVQPLLAEMRGHDSSDPAVLGPLVLVVVVSLALGLVVPLVVANLRPAATRRRLTWWLVGLTVVQMTALVVLATASSFAGAAFVVGASMAVVVDRARSVRGRLLGAWLVPLTPRAERATALSTMSQADAVSQVTIGPVFGLLGNSMGMAVAVGASALALAPSLPAFAAAGDTAGRGEPVV
jgi:MFS transporter, DHA3 family, tetracycline resistance protein